jgi:aminoglycoside phosphotransferase (APT) family kinase protein
MEQPIINEGTAEAIAEHHYGKKPKKTSKLGGGLSNFVYEVEMENKEKLIIRLSDIAPKISQFTKEQWAVAQARERGVPAPEILEVGNEVVPNPYMIVRKIEGTDATKHPERMKIIKEMGKYAAIINTIPTTGFGQVFDWSNNTLSKKDTWKEFLEKELIVPERLETFEKNEIFTPANFKKLKEAIREMEQWDKSPTLNHSDIRLKNMMVDKSGKIVGILDWENCNSNIAPYWEVSIALHDLTIDEKQVFLEGYGIREKDFRKISEGIKTLNIINYAPVIELMAERKDVKGLEYYRLRLNGNLDLYSL